MATDAAKALREARVERGLDQAELAARAGTTQTYVSRVERGVTAPSVATLARLFNAMGLRLNVVAEPVPLGNVTAEELRRDYLASTPGQRVEQAMALAQFLTGLAAGSAAAARSSDSLR